MTRVERLAQTEARARAKLDVQRKQLAQVQAAQREEERKALHRRRVRVGTLADQAGLFSLDDTTLAELFATFAPLREVSDPVAVLAALLQDACGLPGKLVPGSADPSGRVAPMGPVRRERVRHKSVDLCV